MTFEEFTAAVVKGEKLEFFSKLNNGWLPLYSPVSLVHTYDIWKNYKNQIRIKKTIKYIPINSVGELCQAIADKKKIEVYCTGHRVGSTGLDTTYSIDDIIDFFTRRSQEYRIVEES